MPQIVKDIGAYAAIVLSLIAVGTWIVSRLKKIVEKANEPLHKVEASVSKIEERFKAVETIVEQNRQANLVALKYEITRAHREYVEAGIVSRMQLEYFYSMHEKYKAMGGNGFLDKLVGDVDRLEIKI